MEDAIDFQHCPEIELPLCGEMPLWGDMDAPVEDDPDVARLCASERRRGLSARPPAPRRATADRAQSRDERPIELVLYVSAISPHSATALRNIRRALAQFSGRPFTLTVHDLSQDPERGARDGVHFTPTLVSAGRGPRTWILGHLENRQVLQAFLESAFEQLRSK
jgi:hypothetical protein